MGQQAGIDGLFCKRQIERIRAHLRRFACQRDIDLVGDRAAFKVDFRAEVANLKQVKTIHFRQPRLELLLQRLTVINTFWERAPVYGRDEFSGSPCRLHYNLPLRFER